MVIRFLISISRILCYLLFIGSDSAYLYKCTIFFAYDNWDDKYCENSEINLISYMDFLKSFVVSGLLPLLIM